MSFSCEAANGSTGSSLKSIKEGRNYKYNLDVECQVLCDLGVIEIKQQYAFLCYHLLPLFSKLAEFSRLFCEQVVGLQFVVPVTQHFPGRR